MNTRRSAVKNAVRTELQKTNESYFDYCVSGSMECMVKRQTCMALVLLLFSQAVFAQNSVIRVLSNRLPPSNESASPPTVNTYGIRWSCYDALSGRLHTCDLLYEFLGLANSGLITTECVPDAAGNIPPTTCGNGGHLDAAHTGARPTIFKNRPIQYALADPNKSTATKIVGLTSAVLPLEPVLLDVSNVAGIYHFRAELRSRNGRNFGSDKFPDGHLEWEGFIDVKVPGLVQLPDPGPMDKYTKVNGGGAFHTNPVAYYGSQSMVSLIPILARAFSIYNGNTRLLSANDMSLPKGGLFDIAYPNSSTPANQTANWTPIPGHISHREGEDLDINTPNNLPCVKDYQLRIAVNTFLKRNPVAVDPVFNPLQSALYCEPLLGENAHIDFTGIKEVFIP